MGVFELGPPNRSLHKTRHEMAGLGLLFGMYPTPPSQSLDVMTYSFRNCKARMISFKLHDCQSMAYTLTGPLTPDSAEAQSFIASSPPSPPVAIHSPDSSRPLSTTPFLAHCAQWPARAVAAAQAMALVVDQWPRGSMTMTPQGTGFKTWGVQRLTLGTPKAFSWKPIISGKLDAPQLSTKTRKKFWSLPRLEEKSKGW